MPEPPFAGDALIPALEPWGLHVVPGYDAADDAWRARWTAWRDRVYALIADLHGFYARNPRARGDMLAACKDDPAFWLTLWGWLEEPRDLEDYPDAAAARPDDVDLLDVKPFVPFAGQVHLIRWFQETMRHRRRDGYVSKSRGWGGTYVFCGLLLHGWRFRRPWRVRVISAKEEKVDKPLDLDSIFAKMDLFLDHLPPWMLPAGFDPEDFRLKRMLKNPETGAQVGGESTTADSTRGGRATLVLVDEAAFIDGFRGVWGTAAGATNHRFALSTESFGKGREWYDAWNAAKLAAPETVRELHYHDNPYFDAAWYEEEKLRWADNPAGFACEYERNPFVGDRWLYPNIDRCPETATAYDPATMLVVGIDPGHADPTALCWGQPTSDPATGQRGLHWLEGYERAGVPPEWFAHVLTGIDPEPGDKAYADWDRQGGWSPRERELAEWTRTLPWSGLQVRAFMDPAGTQQHTDLETFYLRLLREMTRLRQRLVDRGAHPGPAVPIQTLWEALKGPRGQYAYRKEATLGYAPYMTFRWTEGGRLVKRRLRDASYPEPGTKATTEVKPLHDLSSHMTSAVEFVCVYASLGFADPPKTKSGSGYRVAGGGAASRRAA